MFSLLLLLPFVAAASFPPFVPPGPGPESYSPLYVGACNDTLPKTTWVEGAAFNRFYQVWFENTDFSVAFSNPTFQKYAKQGVLLTSSYGVTHPSEPNYAAVIGGSYFGMADDNFHAIPANITTVIDTLEQKGVSWASYQENMPYNGYYGFNYTQPNYVNASAPPYTYYVRKHNPPILYNSIANESSRANRVRNFDCFARDLNASALPQWAFITPNLVNDGHDTNITWMASWLDYWLAPLLLDPNFNDEKTLIVLTFDENGTSSINNNVWTLLLGNAVPEYLWGTTDSTFYTHYSAISTVTANWRLDSLGREDTNKTMSNVYSFVAEKTGYKNLNVTGSAIPLLNLSGTTPGPLNPNPGYYAPWPLPNYNATGAGGEPVFPRCPSYGMGYWDDSWKWGSSQSCECKC